MRKVCRLAREVLDITAAAVRPGITTDELDEICHNACIEREVSIPFSLRVFKPRFLQRSLTFLVLPFPVELQPLPQVPLHFPQRDCLPRHSRQTRSLGRRHHQPRHFPVPRRLPRRSQRNVLRWRQSKSQQRCRPACRNDPRMPRSSNCARQTWMPYSRFRSCDRETRKVEGFECRGYLGRSRDQHRVPSSAVDSSLQQEQGDWNVQTGYDIHYRAYSHSWKTEGAVLA